MKKVMTLMLGLSLVLASTWAFAGDGTNTTRLPPARGTYFAVARQRDEGALAFRGLAQAHARGSGIRLASQRSRRHMRCARVP